MGGKDANRIYYGKPMIYDDTNSHYMYPNEARLRNMTYGMTIHYDIEIDFITILDKTEMDEDANDAGLSGGAKNDAAKKRTNKKKTLPINARQTLFTREPNENDAVNKHLVIQKHTIILEKIYLGKFPIMVQSKFCILANLPKDVRHTMGECRNEQGGYFIIDGKEKTVVPQEKFADNMLYVKASTDDKYLFSAEIRSVSENVAKPIRTLSVKLVAASKKYSNMNIVVSIPNVRKPIPLFIVFRALGIITDKEIIKMCLLDLTKYESMLEFFRPSVHDAGGIMTQQLALEFISSFTKGKTTAYVLEILADYFLPHIGELNLLEKAYYLGYITFRLLNVYSGNEPETDRDNYKYKRVELVGTLMTDLFREYYSIQLRQIHLLFEEQLTYNEGAYENNLEGLIKLKYESYFANRAVEKGFKKAFKGNWGAQTHTKRIGVIQDLNRLSFTSMMSHLRKTNLPLDASVKLVGPRVLHSTHWGLFDPIDTPDGGNIGIHKHLAVSTYITRHCSREPMIAWLRKNADLTLLADCSPFYVSKMTKVMVNGYFAGVLEKPIETVEKAKLYRRNGLLPTYSSITFDIKQNTIIIYTDGGRPCRPLFYRDNETQSFSFDKDSIYKLLKKDKLDWTDLICGYRKKKVKEFDPKENKFYEIDELYEGVNGITDLLDSKAIIDYMDTSEADNSFIALQNETLHKDMRQKYTHMEIHESLLFGIMCNQITFPENNPATRNSFSCGQTKQACSLYHTNYQLRMDKSAIVLQYGQIPLVKSRYLEHIHNEENSSGENTIVAVMCYTGYNVEDAILINQGALDRGLFRTTYYTTYEAHEEKAKTNTNTTEKVFANIENESNIIGTKPGYDYSKLDKYGIVRENTEINDKTVLIGETVHSGNDTRKVDASKTPKKGQLGFVDKTFITEGGEGTRIAKVRIRETRIPNIGDKMASRNGQKGTVGMVIPEADMPFTKDGIRPDIIINPHAIPSRMTIGQLIECVIGKASLMYGGFADCTAFNNKGSKVQFFGEMLTRAKFHSSGNEILYNGFTGEQIDTEIFIGPTYYMRLKHMVKDKINYRALGPRTALTRQPVSGRANDGGLRIGEMERDSVISHGACEFLRESMMERGDKYFMAVCNTTGLLAIYNPTKKLFFSPMADGPVKFVGSLENDRMNIENVTKFGRSFSIICVPYSLKLLMQELQTMNIQLRIITDDNIHQLENMTFSKNIEKLTLQKFSKSSETETAKQIINKIIKDSKNAILDNKIDIMKSPEYVADSQETSSFYSPDFPSDVSPAYEPTEEEREKFLDLEYFQPTTPEMPPPRRILEPISPDMPPPPTRILEPTTPDMPPPPTRILEPTTPDMPPPTRIEVVESSIPTSNPAPTPLLKTSNFEMGEMVKYTMDTKPDRLWEVVNVGDEFLKIETEDREGLEDTIRIVLPNTVKVVAPNEIPSINETTGGDRMMPIQLKPELSNTDSSNKIDDFSQIPDLKTGFLIKKME